jgi:hypothetical protein
LRVPFLLQFPSHRNILAMLAITTINSTGSVGLAMWHWKPALSARSRSSFPANAVSAIAGIRCDAATPRASSIARIRRSAV